MDRTERLASLLLQRKIKSSRSQDFFTSASNGAVKKISGSRASNFRISRDLFDNEDDSTDVEDGWLKRPDEHEETRHHSFFDDDEDSPEDLDLEDREIHPHGGAETLRKTRLKLLAGMTWASLGEPTAVVAEVSPNELSVKVQDLSWKIRLDDEGRVTLSGFDSGSEQFVGKLPESNAEQAIIKVSENIHQLLSDDIDERSTPSEPPVHFGPEETPGETEPEGGEAPPAAPGGDQGVNPEENPLPPDLGMAPPAAGAIPAQPGLAPPPPAPMPPTQPGMSPPPQYPGMPMATRYNPPSRQELRRRLANSRMEGISRQLRSLGAGLGEDGEETFGNLANRVDHILEVMEQTDI